MAGKMLAGVARGGGGSGFNPASDGGVHGGSGMLGASVARNGDANNNTDSVGSRVMGDGPNLATMARSGNTSQQGVSISTEGGTRKGFSTAAVVG